MFEIIYIILSLAYLTIFVIAGMTIIQIICILLHRDFRFTIFKKMLQNKKGLPFAIKSVKGSPTDFTVTLQLRKGGEL